MANKYWKGQKPKRLKHMHPLPLDSHCQHLRATVTVVLLLIFSTKMVFQFSCVVARVLCEFASRTGSPDIFGFFSFVTTYLLKNTVTFQKPDFVLPWVQGLIVFFWGTGKPTKSLIEQLLCYHMAKIQKHCGHLIKKMCTIDFLERKVILGSVLIEVFVSRQLKAGSGILWGNSCFIISHYEFDLREVTSWKCTLDRTLQSFLPICLCTRLFKSSCNHPLPCCVKESNRAEKWSFSLSF